MDDSFFGFRTDVPSLGEGKVDMDFLTAEVDDEEEYDALNDQTFGSGLASDWEEGQEKLADFIDLHSTPETKFETNLSNKLTSRTDSYNDDSNSHIEHAISQLVLEDDMDDPAIMGMLKTKSPSTHNQVFGSLSPPPAAIVESDHVGSPSTNSIWSASPLLSNVVGGNAYVTSVLNSFRTLSPPLVDLSSEDPSIVLAAKDISLMTPTTPPKLIPNVKTVEEIERDLFLNSQRNHLATLRRALTHDEVEREIFLKPKVRTVSEIERESVLGSIPLPPPVPHVIRPPPGLTNGGLLPIPTSGKNEAFPVMHHPMLHPAVTSPLTIRGPRPRMSNADHVQAGQHPLLVGQFRYPGNVSCNRPMLPFALHGQVHPSARLSVNFNDQRTTRRFTHSGQPLVHHQGNQVIRPRVQQKRNSWSEPGSLNMHHQAYCWPHHNGYTYRSKDVGEEDEYANLMSQKEKDWLVRIQLLQLQTDNPYLDDFYYTTLMLKKRNRELSKDKKEPTVVMPELSKTETKAYQPAQFEGSLGRLQVLSVNCPRKMIDVNVVHHDEVEGETQKVTNKDIKRFRQILFQIEKLYLKLLETGDLDKKAAALPEEARCSLYDKKAKAIEIIYSSLVGRGCDNFIQIMSVRKGRNLLLRTLPLLSEVQKRFVVDTLLSTAVIILKKDQHEPVIPRIWEDLNDTLQTSNFSRITELALRLVNQNIDVNVSSPVTTHKQYIVTILSHKVGLTILSDLTKRSEELHKAEDDVLDEHLKTTWLNALLPVIEVLITMPENLLPRSTSVLEHLVDHLQRYHVDDAKLQSVQLRIKLISGSSQVCHVST